MSKGQSVETCIHYVVHTPQLGAKFINGADFIDTSGLACYAVYELGSGYFSAPASGSVESIY